jgi:ElaB/YqjD/DUF883 family membrane-anchored ribosome-binding protein
MVNPRKGKENEPNRYYTKDPAISVKSEHVEPIISDELYNKVNAIRDKNNVKISGRSGRTISNDHLLSGLVKCQCGYSQMLQLKHERVWYYHCHGRRLMGKAFCDAKYIREDELDTIVINDMKDLFLSSTESVSTMNLLRKKQDDKLSHLRGQVGVTNRDIDKTSKQLNKLTNDYLNGELTASVFNKISQQLELQLSELQTKLIESQMTLTEMEQTSISQDKIDYVASLLERWNTLDKQQQKHLLGEWIVNVVAFKDDDGNIRVDINYIIEKMEVPK